VFGISKEACLCNVKQVVDLKTKRPFDLDVVGRIGLRGIGAGIWWYRMRYSLTWDVVRQESTVGLVDRLV